MLCAPRGVSAPAETELAPAELDASAPAPILAAMKWVECRFRAIRVPVVGRGCVPATATFSIPLARGIQGRLHFKRILPRFFLCVLLLLCGSPLQGQQFNVQTHQLTNGMKILMLEDHAVPNVALYFFHRLGSRNERAGLTGLSLFFEHMMFNGAKRYGPSQFDRVVEDSGGQRRVSLSKPPDGQQ